MNVLKLDLYRIFMTAAEAGNFTEAGKRLYMTQSAVSQAVAQLETALGSPLFLRTGRGVLLNAEGEALRHHLEAAFSSITAAENAVLALRNLEAGSLHIAASDTLCRYFLLPYLQLFHEKHPSVHIQVTNRPSPACLAMVHRREADIAFVNRSDYPPPPGILLTNVLDYEDIFMGNDTFKAKYSGEVEVAQLLKEPLILLEEGSSTRQNLERWAASQSLTLIPSIEAGSVDVILDLVSIGLGIGWIPGYALNSTGEKNAFRLVTHTRPPGRSVAMASGSAVNRTARAFMTMIATHL